MTDPTPPPWTPATRNYRTARERLRTSCSYDYRSADRAGLEAQRALAAATLAVADALVLLATTLARSSSTPLDDPAARDWRRVTGLESDPSKEN
ncbi:hypothetical protein [Bailinhaonella thermotolerans]|uniref:Uncharacterized protein n=1 Tax=Bailinhaonella thermotolerans TaxID=1070861 RepID=A0A3A3ZZF4_9ACTN|nr:hypothetical protein [Bailinhaonella thermotolerans]RJL21079.1 hypothetical protein D5H75_38350 [Bailinhaonella thermotolerans]